MELARLFARQGHEVYLAESTRFPLTRFSNSVTRYIRVPPARFNPREYVNALSNIITKERIDVCIPNLEEIFYIARSMDRIPSSCLVWTDSFEKLDILHNKWTFIQNIKALGFQTPKTQHAASRQMLISRLAGFSFEKAVVKPAYSRFASQTFLWNRGDRLPRSIQPTEAQPWIVQEFIDGHHLCTFSLTQKDKLLAHSIYPSQQHLGIGSSTVFENINNDNVTKWVERFISKMNFTGQIGFDFIETPSGILYPIECNPRTTSGIHLFNKTPELVAAFFGDKKNDIVIPKGTEIRAAKFWLAVKLVRSIFAFEPIREWEKTWRHLHRTSDVFYEKGDLWPVVGHLIGIAEILYQSGRLGISPREIATRDCDYNGIDETT
jgi:predicted ATP-grasp superfamily ATP-dependent carboligase